MPQLEFHFYCAQIFWLLISFGILFFAVKFWLLPPLENIIKERDEKIKDILRQADKFTAQAQLTQKAYQQYVDEAKQYSSKVLQTVHDEIALSYAQQEKNLMQTLAENTKQAEDNIQKIQTDTLNRLETIAQTFVKAVLKFFYRTDISNNVLQEKVASQIKEEANVG